MKSFHIVREHRRRPEELRSKIDLDLGELRRVITNLQVQWDCCACSIAGSGSVTRPVFFTSVTHRIELRATLTIEQSRLTLSGQTSAQGPFPGKAEEETVKQLDRIVSRFVA